MELNENEKFTLEKISTDKSDWETLMKAIVLSAPHDITVGMVLDLTRRLTQLSTAKEAKEVKGSSSAV